MNFNEVAGFLRARRERLQPSERGITTVGPRRTPGLRREEVAGLAGISTEYYTQLEQARGRRPSRAVLEKIAHALDLTRHESSVLFELAGISTAYPQAPVQTLSAGVKHILERVPEAAMTVLDAKLDVIAWNPLAVELLGDFAVLPGARRNLARRFFFNEPGQPPHFGLSGVEQYEPYLVMKIRQASYHYPDDAPTRMLLEELMQSPRFRELWDSKDAYVPVAPSTKTMTHPRAGELELDCVVFRVPDDDQEIVMFTAKPGSPSATRLRSLQSGA